MPAILPPTTCAAIQHVGERHAHPLPYRHPAAYRQPTLCAQPASLVGRQSNVAVVARPCPRAAGRLPEPGTIGAAEAVLGQGRRRPRTWRLCWDALGRRLRPHRPSKPWDCPAPTCSTRPRPCGQGGRGRETHGHGRPHSGHPASDTGHRTRGHWTRTGDERHSKHSDVLDSHNHEDGRRYGEPSCGAGACGAAANDGSTMGTLRARPQPPQRPGSCSVLLRRRWRASAHCSPWLEFDGTAEGDERKAGEVSQGWWRCWWRCCWRW